MADSSGSGRKSRRPAPSPGGLALALLVALLAACQSAPPPTESLPAYLLLSPCGGAAELQRAGSSEPTAAEGRIMVDALVRLTATGDEGARVCAADGSVLDMGPSTVIDLRPADRASRLEIDVLQGQTLFLAQQPSYQFSTPACSVSVSDVPARLQVENAGGTMRLLVEQGSATCPRSLEPITLERCWEMLAAPDEEPTFSKVCDLTPTPTPTNTPTATPTPTNTPTNTPTATPTPTPTATPTATPTPTATRRPFIPSPTPTATPTYVPSPSPSPTPSPQSPGPSKPDDSPKPKDTPRPSPIP